MGDVVIMDGEDGHIDECIAIARRLPEHFTERAVEAIEDDLRDAIFYVAIDRMGVAGFIVVRPDMREREADIAWMAVRPSILRQGIGTLLLGRAETEMRIRGVRKMRIRTLAEEACHEPYEGTRRFYEVNGFDHVVTIPDYPLWDDGNPCAVYEKEL
ncbi:MAG: GNAT family N-acetyltransferase [Thermoplasmata archaeon]|nr:GNAT family N-acetyltransferase [Thermoplasmata archaeon]